MDKNEIQNVNLNTKDFFLNIFDFFFKFKKTQFNECFNVFLLLFKFFNKLPNGINK